ncbi:nicotinamidase-related amidase [Herbaspirillum rubrisubalbicans]|uniref:cysteine hydrolase family protein n=1 Tax=Herbaspirillum rubrisubalbicans TaxID=80842 RepID=UPI00155909D1|nr:cysteine hydrolase family protein [Herbaspirillum rubrisubalbicans]MCP1575093.1 nicotinamidase-related amidase [Herbaspirillum rubrisubalbicans]NQE49770.1 isochorismatase [Herbaspirillum rubrisubalbicans]
MTSALLIIDVQQALCSGADAVANAEPTIASINQLSQRARTAGVPVIFVQHEDHGALTHESPGWQLAAGLHHQTDDLYLGKRGSDAFHQTQLEALLQSRGVRQLVICGMQTEFCVESTVRRALALGFPVTLAAGAHTTAPNGVLSVADVIAHHQTTLANLGAYGVRTTITAASDIRF